MHGGVQGYGEELLKNRKQKDGGPALPTSSIVDHSHRTTRAVREGMGQVQLTLSRRAGMAPANAAECEPSPLAGFSPVDTPLVGVNLLDTSDAANTCGCGTEGACDSN
jgi:hypothetical protein